MYSQGVPQPDVLIAGAGIIGLALALELHARGARVAVLERDTALSHASTAAAGMLAAHDPYNPPDLAPLSQLSLRLYPAFLERIERLSGIRVPFHTYATVQYLGDGSSTRLVEQSLDPRQLAPALLRAVQSTSIDLREHTGSLELSETPQAIHVRNSAGDESSASFLIHANGPWFRGQHAVVPRKGQMLRVQLPASLALREVHRAEHIYVVPRTLGPYAGTALIGATVEDAGFDVSTNPADLARLQALATEHLPGLANATVLESWAGIRAATADSLPLLGPLPYSPREIAATGHFRNGILLAPATAHVLADLLEGKPALDLTPYAPARFAP